MAAQAKRGAGHQPAPGHCSVSPEDLKAALASRMSAQEQERLANARVAVAGLGGLGSHIAVMLARSGVGHLLLVDFDAVDLSNINRQAYGLRHLGMPKTQAMRQILEDINPYLDVQTLQVRVSEKNAADIFASWPLVCEAFDAADQKAMLVAMLLGSCPNTIVISGSGMAGYADANLIQTKQRLKRLYVCGDETSDIAHGAPLVAARVAVCAGHQANKALQLILEGALHDHES